MASMPGMQIKVLDKAVRVVELLAQSNRGVRLKDVIAAVALNKTTALRILRVLESHDLAARDGAGVFVLGSRVLWWENCYRRNFELLAVVRPVLERLRDVTGETVTFSILMHEQTVVIDQVVSRNVTSTRFELGSSAPLHAGASGKVILAHLGAETQKKFLRLPHLKHLTQRTITSRVELEKELKKCRLKGFAISRGERFPSTCSIAAPVFGSEREVVGVISVIGPADRLRSTVIRSIVPLLLKETKVLAEQIGRAVAEQKGSPVGTKLGEREGREKPRRTGPIPTALATARSTIKEVE
jgi:DNA-binding IclR family transcriptional regulator